jgi:ABC-type glycerol-3-phosphate transport system substrate-binding protein
MSLKKLFFGILASLFFLSSCTPPLQMTALIRMIDSQESYFKKTVVPSFKPDVPCVIDVVHYPSIDSIDHAIDLAAGKAGLVKVPFDKIWSLVDEDKIKPLNTFLTDEQLREFNETFLLTSLGQKDGKQYYIPRKFETRILVYRKSRVADVISTWRQFKNDINSALVSLNGYGLPSTYLLEENPSEWDYYDIFVVGWVWAHTPYDGKIAPRVGLRGQRYSGTALGIIDRVYSLGGNQDDILSMSGDAVIDAFEWEAIYAAAGIYNPKMWTEAWSGAGVWQGFSDNEVFLSTMTQLDCFFIHGTGNDGLKGYLSDPDDMGVAVMSRGCSFSLDNAGNSLRMGSRAITTGGWWWGIPQNTPNASVSYQLARHITSAQNQIQECSRFGMIPVRKDILSDMSMLFGGGWVTDIYETSFRQLMENKKTTLPNHPRFDKISNMYLDAWFDIVVGKNWSADKSKPDRTYIKSIINTIYGPRVAELR